MSPKSAQRFWDHDMHKAKCMSPKSAQRFWDHDMHKAKCMSPKNAVTEVVSHGLSNGVPSASFPGDAWGCLGASMPTASKSKVDRAAVVRLLGWLIAIVAISFVILVVAITAAGYLACRFGGDQSGWAQAIGAVLAIVTGFATTLYQLRSQKDDALALEAASGQAAYLLAHDAFEAVTDRLEAALTPQSDSKVYALHGGRTSELVGAMREFETSRLPSAVLADFIRLRSRVAAINQRLTEVYDSEDRLQGSKKQTKRAGRHDELASVVAVRREAVAIFSSLETTAASIYGAAVLPMNASPLVLSYKKGQPH